MREVAAVDQHRVGRLDDLVHVPDADPALDLRHDVGAGGRQLADAGDVGGAGRKRERVVRDPVRDADGDCGHVLLGERGQLQRRIDGHGLVRANLAAETTVARADLGSDIGDLERSRRRNRDSRSVPGSQQPRRPSPARAGSPGRSGQRLAGELHLRALGQRHVRLDLAAANLGALGVEADRRVGHGSDRAMAPSSASGGVWERLIRNRSTWRSSSPLITSGSSEAGPSVQRILIFIVPVSPFAVGEGQFRGLLPAAAAARGHAPRRRTPPRRCITPPPWHRP